MYVRPGADLLAALVAAVEGEFLGERQRVQVQLLKGRDRTANNERVGNERVGWSCCTMGGACKQAKRAPYACAPRWGCYKVANQ